MKEYSEGRFNGERNNGLLEKRRGLAGFFVTNRLAHRVDQTVRNAG
jgi:hypothetical protein